MSHRLYVAYVVLGIALAALAACDAPSNVGADLVGEEGGDPQQVVVLAATLDTVAFEDITGNARRVLAGAVEDPVLGTAQAPRTIAATGYLDFAGTDASDDFRESPVRSVVLELAPDYVYGDTTRPVTLRLRAMPAEWNPSGASADTTLAAGAPVTEFQFAPTDTLVSVALPASWVLQNDEVLRDTTFSEEFHGFALEAVAGNAVVGFDSPGGALRVASEADTVRFGIAKTLTTIRHSIGAPPERVVVQDGTGIGLAFSFELPDSLRDNPLNRATLRLITDEEALDEPAGFVRPRLQQLRLYGLEGGGAPPLPLLDLSLDSEGRFQTDALRQEFQSALLSAPRFERFQIRPVSVISTPGGAQVTNTLNTVLFYGLSAEDRAPQVSITYTPPAAE